MTSSLMLSALTSYDGFFGGGGSHITPFTRKFVAAAFVVILVGACIFVWWLKSEREDD